MGVIAEDTLKKLISSKEIKGNYILLGDDSYLKNMYAKKLSSLIADSEDVFNFHRFTDKCNLQELYDAANQLPMMADKKCIILKDYDFEKADKLDFERLCSLLEENFETAVIILVFEGVSVDYKKSKKAQKLFSCVEKSGGKAFLLNHRRGADLAKMLCNGALKRGCRLDSSAAYYIIETVGDDISTLINELDKLCNYCPDSQITKQTIDLVCAKSMEASIFSLTEKIIACNISDALQILDDLFFARFDEMSIFYTISSAFVDMYRVYAGKKKGIAIPEIAQHFSYKTKAFLLNKAQSNLCKLDYKKLCLCFDEIIKTDSLIKSFNSNSRALLEQLIVRLIYIISKGEKID